MNLIHMRRRGRGPTPETAPGGHELPARGVALRNIKENRARGGGRAKPTVGVVRIHEVRVVVVCYENARASRAANLAPAGVDEAHDAIDTQKELSDLTVRKRHENDYVLNPPEI